MLGSGGVGNGEGEAIDKDVGDGGGAKAGRPKLEPVHEFILLSLLGFRGEGIVVGEGGKVDLGGMLG